MPGEPLATHRDAPAWMQWAALLTVYIVWGSTYLAIAVSVETMPPILTPAIRFTAAGLVLAAVLMLRGGPSRLRISRRELANSALVGVLLLGIGNSMVTVGELTVPSGVAALTLGAIPLIVLVLRRVTGESVPSTALLGVVVGFVGLGVLVIPGSLSGTLDPFGLACLVISEISWAFGSFISLKIRLPRDLMVSTTYQLLSAGLVLGIGSVLIGEWSGSTATWSTRSILAVVYLFTFGSLLAYTAYTWLLQHAPISRVATYAYVNPVVAVALGALILNEKLTQTVLIGAVLIVASVAFTIWADSSSKRRRERQQARPSEVAVEASVSG